MLFDMEKINSLRLREVLTSYSHKAFFIPILIFSFDFIIFFLLIYSILNFDNLLLKALLSILLGLNIGLLFVVGHDCCHNSFTPKKSLNKFLGVISFLPTLHNLGLWEIGHNQIHHAYTNLRVKDYVYSPLSRKEFDTLTRFEKFKYRIYRSSIGHLFYYGIEIWLKKMTNPKPYKTTKHKNNNYWKYQIPIFLYFISLITLIIFSSNGLINSFLLNFLFIFILPFIIWNWIMGFIIYQHHTNTKTRWYLDETEWTYWEAQIENSVHIKFPRVINFLLHNIMEHTAHHSNMLIPMYNLKKAQDAVEKLYNNKVQIINWTPKFYLESIKNCKLYNFETHNWERF